MQPANLAYIGPVLFPHSLRLRVVICDLITVRYKCAIRAKWRKVGARQFASHSSSFRFLWTRFLYQL